MDKNIIEQTLSPDDIYERYIPDYDKSSKNNYLSVFKKESHPSMHVYTDELTEGTNWKKRKFKCHTSGHQGDAYQFIADYFKIDCKTDFQSVLQKINEEFKLINSGSSDGLYSNSPNWKATYYDGFTDAAIFYWEQFKINADLLKKYRVRQIKQLTYINSKGKGSKFDYEKQKLIAFDFVVNGKHKLYIPKQEGVEKKYYLKTQTKTDIFGLAQLQNRKSKIDMLVLAEGEKDVLCCIAHGIPAVCFQSATVMPTKEQMRQLQKIAPFIILCYDNDEPGEKGSRYISNRFNLPIHKLPDNHKDIAEYLPNIGKRFKSDLKTTLKLWKSFNNITVWEKGGCYWKKEKRGQNIVEVKASNFTLQNEALIIGEEKSYRIIRLISNGTVSKSFTPNTDIFTSTTEFSKVVERKGNYFFTGDKKDLNAIKELVFKHCDVVNEVPHIGFYEEQESFVLSNALIKEGKIHTPNELGIVEGVYIPSAASSNKFHSNYQTARKYCFENGSNLTPAKWLENLSLIYSEPSAYVGISFLIASLYFDVISKELRFFPLLNIWGKKGTGKSSLALSLLAPFAKEPERTSLQSTTYTGFLRKLEQTSNIPQWFDEYNNRLSDYKLEALKNIFDLTGKTMGAKTQDSTTKQSKILSSCIISGQEAPTINEALLSRCIIVSLTQSEHSKEKKQLFRALENEQIKGLGNILLSLISHRETMKASYKSTYNDCRDIINQLLEDSNKTANTRLVNNYAAILAAIHIAIDNGLVLHENVTPEADKIKFNIVLMDNLLEQREYEHENQETYIFWECFQELITQNIIAKPYWYNINKEKDELYFRTTLFSKYLEYYRKVHGRNGVDKKTLRDYLKYEDYYKKHDVVKDFKDPEMIERNQAKAYVFSLSGLKAIGFDFNQ